MLRGRLDCTKALLRSANLQLEYEATRQDAALDTSTANSLIYLQAVRYSLLVLDSLGFTRGPLDMYTKVSFIETTYEAWLTVFELVIDFVRSFVISKRKATLLSLQRHLSVFKASNTKGKRLVKLPVNMLRVCNARLLDVAFKTSITCVNPAQEKKTKRYNDDETVMHLCNEYFKRPNEAETTPPISEQHTENEPGEYQEEGGQIDDDNDNETTKFIKF